MKIPVEWLKEYVDLPAKTAELAELLTMSGTKIEGVAEKKGSAVLEAEITTNRSDCLSLWGIAQEVAAVTSKKPRRPAFRDPKPPAKHRLPLQIEVRDRKACPLYFGRVFDSAAVGPSPAWLVRQLEWIDQKPVSNVVDVTNFCLHEAGQPLHAFDYDKLKGARIVVRRARKGERLTALNGVEYTLDERVLVIADAERPVAIAGVMGGRDTEVTPQTRRIVLEAAVFNPILIRRASRLLKLETPSSYRFERGVDPGRVRDVLARASDLFVKLAKAVPASAPIEVKGRAAEKGAWIRLRMGRLGAVLGTGVGRDKAARILGGLGFKVKPVSKAELKVKTLFQRPDVRREIDLVEEVARIWGYDRIPATLPRLSATADAPPSDAEYRAVRRLKEHLAAAGFDEAVTYALLSRKALAAAGLEEGEDLVSIANPQSQEQEILRPSGLVGLLGAIARNVNRKEKDLAFFEVGKRYAVEREETVLSLGVTGSAFDSWEGRRAYSLFYLKGAVENVFAVLRREAPAWREDPRPAAAFESLLLMRHGERELARCGAVAAAVAERWDVKQPVYFAEVSLDEVLKLPERRREAAAPPKFPPVRRDIAFVVARDVPVARLEEAMRREGAPHLADLRLFDQYLGDRIPAGKRSLAFSLEYRKPDGTFTDEEIRRIHGRVGELLRREFQAELR
jgi:phenylalanyl-tRNA synthetase beta chain